MAEEFLTIEPMVYLAGTPASAPNRDRNEAQREITLTRAFQMGATELTQASWRAVMGTDPARWPCATCPVERVSWFDAIAYCNARSRAEGLPECYALEGESGEPGTGCDPGHGTCEGGYQIDQVRFAGLDCPGWRLPTEGEWEAAALAGGPGWLSPEETFEQEQTATDRTRPVGGGSCQRTRGLRLLRQRGRVGVGPVRTGQTGGPDRPARTGPGLPGPRPLRARWLVAPRRGTYPSRAS